MMLRQWGDKWLAPAGAPVEAVHQDVWTCIARDAELLSLRRGPHQQRRDAAARSRCTRGRNSAREGAALKAGHPRGDLGVAAAESVGSVRKSIADARVQPGDC